MCGIVGYVSLSDHVAPQNKNRFLHDAIMLDTFRGMDSTGMITVADEFETDWLKTLDEGWDFVAREEFEAMDRGWAAIAHNRAATRGKVTVDNAHPFKYGGVLLVHNGTLSNMGRNLPNYSDRYDIDSIQICRALGKVKPGRAADVLSEIDGAFALAWTDARDQSINIARNGQRPLHFCHDTSKRILYFMSDGEHLRMLQKRKWVVTRDMGSIYQFAPYKHFKWKRGSLIPEKVDFNPFVDRSDAAKQKEKSQTTKQGQYLTYQSPASKKRDKNAKNSSTSRESGGSTESKLPTRHSTRNTSSGKVDKSSSRIWINGAQRKTPPSMLAELRLVTDLDNQCELTFAPDTWHAYPKHPDSKESARFGYCEGTIWIPGWETDWGCIVHNIPEAHCDLVRQKWMVRPYGVTSQISLNYGYGVMAELVSFDGPEVEDVVNKPEEPEEDTTTVGEAIEELVVGPFGKYYSLSQYLQFISSGCAHCYKDLKDDDPTMIWWVGEDEDSPLCEKCCDELTKPKRRRRHEDMH